MRKADELIHDVVTYAQIPFARRRREIQRELTAHIEDFVDAARDAGHEEQEIELLLMAHFGDARQVAEGFLHVYRYERRTFLVFAYALSTLLIASSLLMAILGIQTGLAFGFGTPISELLASKHTVVQALDIVAFVAVYLGLTLLETQFERCRFQKAAIMLAAIGAVLTMSFRAMGFHPAFLFYGLITGLFFRAVRLFIPAEVARVGIVLVCFVLAGFSFALLRSPVSLVDLFVTCASWLALGMGYLLMSRLAPRVDAAVLDRLQRI
jgi:hypothetical protein